jgi:hypothetical protein
MAFLNTSCLWKFYNFFFFLCLPYDCLAEVKSLVFSKYISEPYKPEQRNKQTATLDKSSSSLFVLTLSRVFILLCLHYKSGWPTPTYSLPSSHLLPWPLFHSNNFSFYFTFLYLIYFPRSHTVRDRHRVRNFKIRQLRNTLLYKGNN